MRKLSDKEKKKAHDLYEKYGSWAAVGEELGINPEAARGRARMYRAPLEFAKGNRNATEARKNALLSQAVQDHGLAGLTEFKAVMSSLKQQPRKRKKIRTAGGQTKKKKILVLSDTHIGHKAFNLELWEKVVKASKDCDFIMHPGDHLEGMSYRQGHVYELDAIGFSQQFAMCVDLYKELGNIDIYGIDGNHDGWYYKKSDQGTIVGEQLARTLPNYHNLGQSEGDLILDDSLWIKLFHPNDGTAYANSYKGQKLVESFTGGEKPHLVLEGHYHKSLFQFIRNVHQFECGTICGQSEFMRLRKLQAHLGFWELVVEYNKTGLTKLNMSWTPGFE